MTDKNDGIKLWLAHLERAEKRREHDQWLRDHPHSSEGRLVRFLTFLFTAILTGGFWAGILAVANYLDIHWVALGATWMPWWVFFGFACFTGGLTGWKVSRPDYFI